MSFITCQQPDKHCPFILLSTHEARMWRQVYTSGWDTCSINMGTTSEMWLPHPDTLSNWAWQLVEHGIRRRLSRKSGFQELAGVKIPGYTEQESQISQVSFRRAPMLRAHPAQSRVSETIAPETWTQGRWMKASSPEGAFFGGRPHVRAACMCVNINWFDKKKKKELVPSILRSQESSSF